MEQLYDAKLTPAQARQSSSWSDYFQVRPPDGDGYLTLGEATWQWQNGGGRPVDVDLSTLDLSGVTAADFPHGVGSTVPFQTAKPWDFLVHGTITLELKSAQTVSGLSNLYDFDLKPWSVQTFIRNSETIAGRIYAGPGTPFRIRFQGSVAVPLR